MVFGFGDRHKDEQDAYNSFYEGDGGQDYEGNKLHEGIAGAAAFYAMKKFEEKREAEGHQDHAFAREMLAAVAGAEVDKLAEQKGMDYEQRERAKEAARNRANQMYETNYGGGGGGGDQSYDQQGGYQQQTNQGFGGDQGFGGAGGDSGYGGQSGGYQAGGGQGYGDQTGAYRGGGGGEYQGGGGGDYQGGAGGGGYQGGGGGGDYQGGGGGYQGGGGGGDYQGGGGGGYNRGGFDQQGTDY